MVISLMLESLGRLPADPGRSPADVLVTVFSSDLQPGSLQMAADLRLAGLKVVCSTEVGKLQKQFKFADRMGMKVALVIGPDEAAEGKVTVKNLADGSQSTLDRDAVAESVKQILAGK
jgi:histidyl-tRNA synthetase